MFFFFPQSSFFITKCVRKCKFNVPHFCYICVLLIGGRNGTQSPPASCLVSLRHVDASSITAYYNVISDAPKQLDVYCAQLPWLITSQMTFPFNRVTSPTILPHPQQSKTTKLSLSSLLVTSTRNPQATAVSGEGLGETMSSTMTATTNKSTYWMSRSW